MKITISALLAVSSVVLLGTAGCAEPGVVQVNPTNQPVKGDKDAGTTPKKDSGKGTTTSPVNPGKGEDDDTDDTDVAEDDADDTDVAEDDGTPPKPVDAGKKDAGSDTPAKTDAGGKADAGKPETDPETAACPATYMCQDSAKSIADMGLEGTITDADGKPVMYSCAKGGQEMCDQKDPKKSCPNFPNAFCMHVKLTGLISADIYQCGQKCTP